MRGQMGFSLLEVLVAGAVTAIGLAGLAALLLGSTTLSLESDEAGRAARLAGHLAALAAMTPGVFDVFEAAPPPRTTDCRTSDCTAREFAEDGYRRWQSAAAAALPGATGSLCRDTSPEDGVPADIACSGDGPLFIKLFWRDPRSEPPTWRRHVRQLPL